MRKLLSIAIPTYNRKGYLRRALDSILCQYDERVELIVSDNCSTDGTEELVRNNYENVKYYKNNSNIGMLNFIKGYDRATGKYVMLFGDDDVFIEGTMSCLLDFLERENDMSVVFLNHRSFIDDYVDSDHCMEPFFSESVGNVVTNNRYEFMSVARHQITFISCILLLKDAYRQNEPYDEFYDNHFLQACVAFKCMSRDGASMGIVSTPCIAQNLPSKSSPEQNMDILMNVFGTEEYQAFSIVGPYYKQDKKQMDKIYSNMICRTWPRYIMYYKTNELEWKSSFWSIGFPICKRYAKSWLTIIPVALLPTNLAVIIQRIRRLAKGNKDER